MFLLFFKFMFEKKYKLMGVSLWLILTPFITCFDYFKHYESSWAF